MRRTVGFLLNDTVTDEYMGALFRGALDAARAREVDLVCFAGAHPEDPGRLPQNLTLLSQIRPGNVDGLITVNLVDRRVVDHIPAFSTVPTVSIQPSTVPSVLADNYAGMRAALEHLARVHGRTRIAFVRGTAGDAAADERFRAYEDVVAASGRPFEPALVYEGRFRTEDGRAAVEAWSGVSFDGVAAANDGMAFGVLDALEARGRAVPRDVSVVGFDAVAGSGSSRPPLTTVRQPLEAMAARALDMVLAMLRGEAVRGREVLPASLVLRRSCGCHSAAVVAAGRRARPWAALSPGRDGRTRRAMEDAVAAGAGALPPGWAAQLLGAWRSGAAAFLPALESLLAALERTGVDAAAAHGVLSALREAGAGLRAGSARAALHQGRVLIDETGRRQLLARAARQEAGRAALRRITRELGTTFDVDGIADLLGREAVTLGLSSVFLALYEGETHPVARSRLVLASVDGQRRSLPPRGLALPTADLLPRDLRPQGGRQALMVLPVVFNLARNDQIGYAVFSVGPEADGLALETLAERLGGALRGALLFAQRAADQHQLEVENTVRQKAEVEARRERDLLSALMDQIPDPIYFKDLEGRFTRVNAAKARALQLPGPREAIGRAEADFVSPEAAHALRDEERAVLADGRAIVGKVEHDVRSGRYALVTKAPIRSPSGDVQGLVVVAQDVTASKVAEARLNRDLAAFQDFVSAVAQGDLTRRGLEGDGVIGSIAAAVNAMTERFSAILSDVQQAALAVSSSSTEILAAANEIASGAQFGARQVHEASSVAEGMAASMERVLGHAEASASRAREVLRHVGTGDDAVVAAHQGMARIDAAVLGMADKMKALEHRSREVFAIIDLMDEIAAQSKLLSLNAAIEAAHAGEAGRGFGVVADEVRRLADGSSSATRDVAERVEGIVSDTREVAEALAHAMREVASGLTLSADARKSLSEIPPLVEDSVRLALDIAAASREQAFTTRTVAQSMQSISTIVLESSTGSAETSRAVQDLVQLSDQLAAAISRFKIDAGG
jgi:PAS domain S-box-containing protein